MQDQHDGNLSRKHNLDEHLLGDTKLGNTRVHWKPMCKVSTHWLYDGYCWGSVSCEKHFDFTVKRWGNFLQGEALKSEFKFLCESVLRAETPLIYKRAAERMDKFIAVDSHLQLWWDWWQKCKSYVFSAFKPLYNVPKENHAEKSIHDGLRWVQGTWPW